jgi:hypothetical protein
MSIEAPAMEHSEEDIEAAKQMLEGSEYLSKDGFAREVLEAGGVLGDGRTVDLGNFLAARQDYLMSKVAEARYEGRIANNPDLMVVSSVAPNLENYL